MLFGDYGGFYHYCHIEEDFDIRILWPLSVSRYLSITEAGRIITEYIIVQSSQYVNSSFIKFLIIFYT